VIFSMYQALAPVTKRFRALQFAPDKTFVPRCFASLTFSTYEGENSMDMMNTGLQSGSYDLIASNHVLEHVKDHFLAIREMIRVVGREGIVHVCVPSPAFVPRTKDWGFADPARTWHFRSYGADAGRLLAAAMDGLHVVCGIGRDPVTDTFEMVYWLSLDEERLFEITTHLQRGRFPVVVIH
jgi:hypothetical protein